MHPSVGGKLALGLVGQGGIWAKTKGPCSQWRSAGRVRAWERGVW